MNREEFIREMDTQLKLVRTEYGYTQEMMAETDFAPASMIKGHKIVFRPDAALKKEVARDFKLQRISSEAMK